MADYQVVCIKQERCRKDPKLIHVAAAGTGDWTLYNRVWSPLEILNATAHGDRFYLQSRVSSETADLACALCPGCFEVHTLVSSARVPPSLEIHGLPRLD
jgi:hypothetical protein